MGKFEIIEHLYPERRWISFTIKGHNPWAWVFKKYVKLVAHIFEISSSKIYLRFLMVDDFETYKGGSTIYYRYHVDFVKPWDNFTKFWVETRLSGSQDIKTKEGVVEFKFHPYLRTKFEYVNQIQKSLIDLYWLGYYQKRVNTLKEQNKALFEKTMLEIKSALGVKLVEEKVEEGWKEGF